MKILVTGANGYLGRGIVKRLIDDGVEVIATDFYGENIDKRATTYISNIFEIDNPYSFFGEPDVLLHLAWRDGFVHNSESHLSDLYSHYLFIRKIVDGGCKRIAILGTMHEIGYYEGCVREDTPCNPQSLYGIAKNALRNAVAVLCSEHKVSYQWLRGFYIVGSNEKGNSIFSKIVIAQKEGKQSFPFTTGNNQYDFLDYDVFCAQVSSAVQQDSIDGIINICSGYPQKIADRVERFIRDNGFSIKLNYGVFPDRKYDSKKIWGDDSKIRKIMRKAI